MANQNFNSNLSLEVLNQRNAVIMNQHIVYTSGLHGTSYINKDAIYPDTELTSELCRQIAEQFINSKVDCVIAPAVGGIIVSQWTAHHLTQLTGKSVLGLYAEKSEDGKSFVIKRGYDALARSKRVLVVEDVLTTGGSVRKVVETLRKLPAEVVGVGALCNRGQLTPQSLGAVPKLFSLIDLNLETWEASTCPLCAKKIPINIHVGKGREFLQSQGISVG
jgi:orotate phosphoribosyltransferase